MQFNVLNIPSKLFEKPASFFLEEVEGLEIGLPKGVIRSFLQVGLFTEDQTVLGLSIKEKYLG